MLRRAAWARRSVRLFAPGSSSRCCSSFAAWLQTAEPRPGASIRVVCFPHGGGSAVHYRGWAKTLGPDFELVAIQPPGRAERSGEPFASSLAEYAAAVASALAECDCLNKPFCFFGDSVGSWAALQTVRELQKRQLPLPAHLFVSGNAGPSHAGSSSAGLLHESSDEQLIALSLEAGMPPGEVLGQRELRELLVAALRADIRAAELHNWAGLEPLALPLSVFYGTRDTLVTRRELEAWRGWSSGAFEMRGFEGDHFYTTGERQSQVGLA